MKRMIQVADLHHYRNDQMNRVYFPEEVDAYLKELDNKGIQYSVIRREKLKLRIRKQYNKNTLLRKG